jgi:hypothetical protein
MTCRVGVGRGSLESAGAMTRANYKRQARGAEQYQITNRPKVSGVGRTSLSSYPSLRRSSLRFTVGAM